MFTLIENSTFFEPVSIRGCPTTKAALLDHLAKSSFSPDRGLLAFTIGLPESDVVGEKVGMRVKPLLTLIHTPYIGYLQSTVLIQSFAEREDGYRLALQKMELELKPEFIFKLPYTEEGSYQSFKQILSKKPELPTAFVTDDDTIATGTIRALTETGISVPDDITVVGFNDRPSCELLNPKLTTVNVPRYSFGSESVDFLIKLIEKREQMKPVGRSIKIRIGTQLIRRESVKKRNNEKI